MHGQEPTANLNNAVFPKKQSMHHAYFGKDDKEPY